MKRKSHTRACRNELLLKINIALLNVMARKASRYAYSEERKRRVLSEHEEILDLLKNRRLEEFRQKMEEHIKRTPTFFETGPLGAAVQTPGS